MDCKDVMALMGKKQISAVSACTKSLNFKSPKEKKERSSVCLTSFFVLFCQIFKQTPISQLIYIFF